MVRIEIRKSKEELSANTYSFNILYAAQKMICICWKYYLIPSKKFPRLLEYLHSTFRFVILCLKYRRFILILQYTHDAIGKPLSQLVGRWQVANGRWLKSLLGRKCKKGKATI